MSKFEVGQAVRAKRNVLTDHDGEIGLIADSIETGYPIEVEFEDGIIEWFEENELELAPLITPPAVSEPVRAGETAGDSSYSELLDELSGQIKGLERQNKLLRTALGFIVTLGDGYLDEAGKVGINFTLATILKSAREALKANTPPAAQSEAGE